MAKNDEWVPVSKMIVGYDNMSVSERMMATRSFRKSNPNLTYAVANLRVNGVLTTRVVFQDRKKSNGPTYIETGDAYLKQKGPYLHPRTLKTYRSDVLSASKVFGDFNLNDSKSVHKVLNWLSSQPIGRKSVVTQVLRFGNALDKKPVPKRIRANQPTKPVPLPVDLDWTLAFNSLSTMLDQTVLENTQLKLENEKLLEALKTETERANQFQYNPTIGKLTPRALEHLTKYGRK